MKKLCSVLLLLLFVSSLWAKQDTTAVLQKLDEAKKYLVNSQLDSAQKLIEQALLLSKEAKYKNGQATAYRYLGLLLYRKGNVDKAIEAWQDAAELYLKQNNVSDYAKMLNNIALIYRKQGDYDNALNILQQVATVFEQDKDYSSLSTVLMNISNIYKAKGDLGRALQTLLNALEKLEQAPQDKETNKIIADLYNSMANIYRWQRDYENAKDKYLQALQVYKQVNNLDGIAMVNLNLGVLEYDNGNFEQALKYYKEAKKQAEKVSNESLVALANYNIGDAALKLGQDTTAMQFILSALEIYKKLGDKRGEASCYNSLGELYFHQNQLDKAVAVLEQAYAIGNKIGDLKIIEEAAKELSMVYAKLGDFKKAYENQLIYKTMYDSIYNKENERKLTQMSLQYQFEREKRESQLKYEAKLRQQRMMLYSAGLVTFFLLLFLFFAIKLYRTKKHANEILARKNIEITRQKQEIEDSIRYAKRIQTAVMPSLDVLKSFFSEYFMVYLPKQIVSGDFFWAQKYKQYLIVAVADCTGHGVPGAFMSMLGITFLREITFQLEEPDPGEILNSLREQVIDALQQGVDSKVNDGMDIALLVVDTTSAVARFAGAYNPLYIVRDDEEDKKIEQAKVFKNEKYPGRVLYELKGTRLPIGGYYKQRNFDVYELSLFDSDVLYMFSDGFADQFNEEARKYTYRNFKSLLLSISHLPMSEQKTVIIEEHNKWRGNYKQIDDIIVLGLRV